MLTLTARRLERVVRVNVMIASFRGMRLILVVGERGGGRRCAGGRRCFSSLLKI